MAASMVRSLFEGTGRLFRAFSQNSATGTRNLASVCRPQAQKLLPVSPTSYSQHVKKDIYPVNSISPMTCISWPITSVRTLVRYSQRHGKRKTVRAVVGRFLRLDWGIYIRTRAGRHKKKWKKPDWIIERGKHHVFCNKQQSRMFDKMVTSSWKRKRNLVEDPYERYQKRFGMNDLSAPKFLP